ncbi:MAG: hypothetical protein H7Y32_01335 [Chloroflexales bacterium]|nr:hypothetical protein [Chloroflexales bacterium]
MCQPGLSVCADQCVSLSASNDHCGACGTACTAPAVCANGMCSDSCADGFTKCGDACADLAKDSAHCGSCELACESGQPCVGGVCGCPEQSLFCEGQCFDPMSSSQHCGNCATACMGGMACVDGACACPEGEQLCGSECSALNTPDHCGTCEQTCDAGESCSAGVCGVGCANGLTACGAACVNLQTTPSACGSCDIECAAGQVCAGGVCACPDGKTLCGGACVDTATSSLHCGACAAPCTVGQSCQAGSCRCPVGAIICDNACTNAQTDVNHCGNCSTRCMGGLPCTNGVCECPAGETLCAGACLSTDSTAEHCGACGVACPTGESCVAGQCSGAIGDACTNTLAVGISIREIAVYQAGKIPVMQGGNAVAAGARPAAIIQSRPARVRVFVDLESGWASRVVSARLLLTNGDLTPSYFAKRTVSQASTENSFATTFNFDVTPEDITATTRYAVEIVECDGTPAGTPGRARFPASADQALETRRTGPLKIRFIPLNANGRTAASDTPRLQIYRDYLARMFPSTLVEYTLGGTLNISQTISAQGDGWSPALDQLQNLHESDGAANDVYYYGLFQPTDTINQYCQGGCVAGIGYVTGGNSNGRHNRVSLGLSYANKDSAETMAHEIGHNHGRPHSPCGGPDDPDPAFPHAGGRIGWWGYEAPEALHNPANDTDIMGYCGNQWVSDYVYRLFTDRVALLNGVQRELPPAGPMQHFLFLLTDIHGPRWGVERKAPRYPSGEPEQANVLDANGNLLTTVTVYRTRTDHLDGAVILVPYPEPGWHAIQVAGAVPLSFGSSSSSRP